MKLIILLISLSNLIWAQAVFKHIRGDVYKYVEINNPVKVKKGDSFEENETIVLRENAQVVIKLGDHSVHRVEGPSEFSFESFAYEFEDSDEIEKPASLLMETGTFFIKVLKKSDNESMKIKTKQTTFGIRGTEFLLDVPRDEKDVILTINEGAVEVNNNDQRDIIQPGSTLFIENDKTFKRLRDNELKKSIDWKFNELSDKKQKFREIRQARRAKIREKLSKWNRNELKWSKFKEQRSKKLAQWKEKTKDLKTNQGLKRREMREELRKKKRLENQEKMKNKKGIMFNEQKAKREELRKKKLQEMKQKRLNRPNSFMDEEQRKMRRQKARQEMMRRRRLESKPPSGTTAPGTPGEQ